MLLLVALLALGGGKTGTLTVKSLAAGAKVLVDGQPAGTTPLVLKGVTAGKHKVKVQRLGYLAQDQQVDVVAGKNTDVLADLLPTAGVLKVTSPTKGALVFVDGKQVGAVPYEGEIAVGKRSVEIRKDGFATYKQQLTVGAGNDYAVTTTLKKGGLPGESSDLPLMAVAPKRTKPGSTDLPLVAPPPPGPKTPLGLQPTPGVATNVEQPRPFYQQWWFWTAAGVAVAAAIVIPVAVTQSQPSLPQFPRQALN